MRPIRAGDNARRHPSAQPIGAPPKCRTHPRNIQPDPALHSGEINLKSKSPWVPHISPLRHGMDELNSHAFHPALRPRRRKPSHPPQLTRNVCRLTRNRSAPQVARPIRNANQESASPLAPAASTSPPSPPSPTTISTPSPAVEVNGTAEFRSENRIQ